MRCINRRSLPFSLGDRVLLYRIYHIVKTCRDNPCVSARVWSVSAVAGLKYHDSDVDRLRALRWNRVLDEGAPDRASTAHVRGARLAAVLHHLFTSTRLPTTDDTTLARPHRDLVNAAAVVR